MGVKFNPFTSKLDIVDSPSGEFSDIELALGTQTAPSLSFTGDPDTGIYSPGADQLAISTNGTGRLFVDASGNVGVGILPSFRLHINEPITTGTNQSLQRITTQSGGSFSIRCSDLSSATPNWEFFTGASEDIVFSPSTTERLRITSDGKVGIGTTSPGSLGSNITTVEIKGGTATRSGGIRLSTSDDSQKAAFYVYDGEAVLGTETAHPLGLYVNNTERARIDSSGNLGIATSTPGDKLEIGGAGAGIILASPDGTRYRLTVANGGTLSIAAV